MRMLLITLLLNSVPKAEIYLLVQPSGGRLIEDIEAGYMSGEAQL